MDKTGFAKLMERPGVLSPEEWEDLRRERERFPFSAPLQVLSLLADKAGGVALWQKQLLPVVELYMNDVERLHELLERPTSSVPPSPSLRLESEPTANLQRTYSEPSAPLEQLVSEPAAVRPPDVPEDFDILKEINAYQEVSFKTAPKSVILSEFLENSGGMPPEMEEYDEVSVQDLAKKSIRPSDLLESETLALVLERQGKLAQAVSMYEKLIVNNPEKSSTFAVRIASLKARMNEDK